MSNLNHEILAERSNKVIYKDGDTVLKVFDSDFSKSEILNEALNQARIEETGLNVPKLLEVSIIDGKWAIRTEYVPGKTLAKLMEENPDKIDEYLDLFVDISVCYLELLERNLNALILSELELRLNVN